MYQETQVKLQGTVLKSSVYKSDYVYELDKWVYSVEIEPWDAYWYNKIEDLVALQRDKYIQHLENWERNELDDIDMTRNPDKFLSKDKERIRFESFIPPKKEGALKDIEDDSGLRLENVNIMGHIKILPDTNAYLSFHLIEPATKLTAFQLEEEAN